MSGFAYWLALMLSILHPSPTATELREKAAQLPPESVAWRESRGRWDAINWHGCDGHGCFGKWQISGAWGAHAGMTPNEQDDLARHVMAVQGPSAWGYG